MKRICLLILCIGITLFVFSQEQEFGITYDYFYANQWDKAIQTYNASRPDLAVKQPLLQHGCKVVYSIFFKSQGVYRSGLRIGYSTYRSKASNEGFTNFLSLKMLAAGYFMRFQHVEKYARLYTEVCVAAKFGALYRKMNEEIFQYVEKKTLALGAGVECQGKIGWQGREREKFVLSPFVSCSFSPYYYTPSMEPVLNQTKGISSKNWSTILSCQLGMAIRFSKVK
jgi:hypothetical protein